MSSLFTADVDTQINGLFGVNQPLIPKQPISFGAAVDGSALGAEDKVVVGFSPQATGDFTGGGGSNPGFFWGMNVFATTGATSGDGNGLTDFTGALIESSLQSDVDLDHVVGLQAEAAFFGESTHGTVTQMESMRVSAPKRKDGATDGVATNVYCLFIESPDDYDVGADASVALFVEGGVSRLQGRLDVDGLLVSFNGTLTLQGDYSGDGQIQLDTNGIGFFGVSPVSRPTLPGSGSVTAANIRSALIALGLCQ